MDRTWFQVKAAQNGGNAELYIFDYIGSFGVTAQDVQKELKALGKISALDVHINSPGGEVFVGNAIMNMLQRFKATQKVKITVYVDGLAASMASLIAMVGDEIVMASNAMMMIHNPWGYSSGDARDLRQYADLLDKLKSSMVTAYSAKSGKDADEVSAIMDDETWYSAEEAVAANFADRVEDAVDIAAFFDLSRFVNPPEGYGEPAKKQTDRGEPAARATKEVKLTKPNQPENPAPNPAPAPAPVAQAPSETPEQMEARIRATVQAEMAAQNANDNAIRNVCARYGLAAKAAEFISAKTPISDVIVALEAAQATQPAPVTSPAPHSPTPNAADAGKSLAKELDRGAIWASFNKHKPPALSGRH